MPEIIQREKLDIIQYNQLKHYSQFIIVTCREAIKDNQNLSHVARLNDTIRYHEGKIREFDKKIKDMLPACICDSHDHAVRRCQCGHCGFLK